jgi:hypothetical protein
MKSRVLLFAGLLLLGISASQCSRHPFALFGRGGENAPNGGEDSPEILPENPLAPTPPEGVTPPPGENPTGSRTDTWIQPADRPLDLIFVTDTSGSLDAERSAMVTALQGFLETLSENNIVDYCIGVMYGHVGTRSGLLQSPDGDSKKCLCRSSMSESEIITQFGRNLKNVTDESTSDGGEASFYSFYKSFSDSNKLDANIANGCYRVNAAVIPVFLSDENEISTSINCASTSYTFNPFGPATVVDGDCKEAPTRKNYYSDSNGNLTLGYEELAEAAEAFSYPIPFFATSVTYMDTYPSGGENEKGLGYLDLVDLTEGDSADLALATAGNQPAFNASFENVASGAATKAVLNRGFDLSQTPCNDGSLIVKVDGVSKPFSWNGAKRVTLKSSNAGEPGSTIEISYNIGCS